MEVLMPYFFIGFVFFGMGFILEIVRYRNECIDRAKQVETLAKIIYRLRDKTDYDENGKKIKVNEELYLSIIKDMNSQWEGDNFLKTGKLDFFWPNLNENHAYNWFWFWLGCLFLSAIFS